MPDPAESSATTDPRAAALARIRAEVHEPDVREVKMFGAVAVMVDGEMLVAVRKDGTLLARVAPTDDERLLAEPGATRAYMGTDRSMGEGWIDVAPAAVAADDDLRRWLDHARARRRT